VGHKGVEGQTWIVSSIVMCVRIKNQCLTNNIIQLTPNAMHRKNSSFKHVLLKILGQTCVSGTNFECLSKAYVKLQKFRDIKVRNE